MLTSMAAHPGYAATHLQSTGPGAVAASPRESGPACLAVGNAVSRRARRWAPCPQLYAATAPDVPGGAFCGPSGFDQMRGHPTLVGSSGAGSDMDVAARLWNVSAELTGVDYAALVRPHHRPERGQAKPPSVLLGGLARSSCG